MCITQVFSYALFKSKKPKHHAIMHSYEKLPYIFKSGCLLMCVLETAVLGGAVHCICEYRCEHRQAEAGGGCQPYSVRSLLDDLRPGLSLSPKQHWRSVHSRDLSLPTTALVNNYSQF